MAMGYEREGETSCICTIANILRILDATYPGDRELSALAQKARLMAITVVAREKADLDDPSCDIVLDRLNDCRRCIETEGSEPCRVNGKRRSCKYHKARFAMKVARRYLGPEVRTVFKKYADILRNELNQEVDGRNVG